MMAQAGKIMLFKNEKPNKARNNQNEMKFVVRLSDFKLTGPRYFYKLSFVGFLTQ